MGKSEINVAKSRVRAYRNHLNSLRNTIGITKTLREDQFEKSMLEWLSSIGFTGSLSWTAVDRWVVEADP